MRWRDGVNNSCARAPAAVVFLWSGLKEEKPKRDLEGASCRPASETRLQNRVTSIVVVSGHTAGTCLARGDAIIQSL